MAVANQKLFTDTCKAMGHPEWATDPRFADHRRPRRQQAVLTRMMEEVLKTDTKENWAHKLRHLPAGPIRTMKEALDEPEVKRRGMLKTYKHTRAATCRSSARTTISPTRRSTTRARRRRSASTPIRC